MFELMNMSPIFEDHFKVAQKGKDFYYLWGLFMELGLILYKVSLKKSIKILEHLWD